MQLAAAIPAGANERGVVTYEAFGAAGDGVTDDLAAICAAHEHANAKGLPVRSKPAATYHLGTKGLTAIIATDTDWSTSKFIIDDSRGMEHPTRPLFRIESLLKPVSLKLTSLRKGARRLPIQLEYDCVVHVVNSNRRIFVRHGHNQNEGSTQQEVFILRKNGLIDGELDWDYDQITSIRAMPMDAEPLRLQGGIFTSIGNRREEGEPMRYRGRNIEIRRSYTLVSGVTHRITGEGEDGHPYRGFLAASQCANVLWRDCEIDDRKVYYSIKQGKPVPQGTYGYHANLVINLRMTGCRMKNIHARGRWGVSATNFMKNFLVEDCTLSRVDVHQGISGNFIIRNSRIGHAGINAIGRGTLLIENSTIENQTLVTFRSDYGSTWDGQVIIRNTRWIPQRIAAAGPVMFNLHNPGTHDFGYPCTMPRNILIDGLTIDDSKAPAKYRGARFFDNPTAGSAGKQPFPYGLTERIGIKNLKTSSGILPRISDDASFNRRVRISPESALAGPDKRGGK